MNNSDQLASRYSYVKIKGIQYPEHILVWERANGPLPEGWVIHHKNGDGHDNRLENLVAMTRGEHSKLHHEMRRDGTDPVDQTNHQIIRCHEYQKKSYMKHRDEIREQHRIYRETHREELRIKKKEYRDTHKEQRRAYVEAHREEMSEYLKNYRAAHHDKVAAYREKRKALHADEIAAYQKAYRDKTREIKSMQKELNAAIENGASNEEILKLSNKIKDLIAKRSGRNAKKTPTI